MMGASLAALTIGAFASLPLTLLAPVATPPVPKSTEGFRRRALRSRRYPHSGRQEGRKFSRQVAEGRLKPENGLT